MYAPIVIEYYIKMQFVSIEGPCFTSVVLLSPL